MISLPYNNQIGSGKTFIIAEIGSNHNQSLELAYQSIDAAIECGADAVKFQSINIAELYFQPSESTKALHAKIDLEEKWHFLISEYCKKKRIIFFSAPNYLKAVDLLEKVDVPIYKLASAQIGTFPQIIHKVAKTGKPIILSTGIVTATELEEVIKIFKHHNNHKLIILHCNSIYPTPFENVHLPLMDELRNRYQCIVGFSDHTPGFYAPIAAVALGASVVEKHFALDKTLPVPDAPFSLEPDEFSKMVDGIRSIEKTLIKNERKDLHPNESSFKESIFYRLVSNKSLNKGKLLNENDFHFLRHPEGINCQDLSNLVDAGYKYNKNIPKNTLLRDCDIYI